MDGLNSQPALGAGAKDWGPGAARSEFWDVAGDLINVGIVIKKLNVIMKIKKCFKIL